jgi:hypothetical protein
MGKDQIVQCLARLRQDTADEPEAGDDANHGVQDGFWRIQPVRILDEIEGLCPKEFAFAVIGPRYTTSNPMPRKRFGQCGTWHAKIVEAISGLSSCG